MSLLRDFTFVLDCACLDNQLEAMSQQLGWNFTSRLGPRRDKAVWDSTPLRAKVCHGNDTVWEFLVARNKYDLLLYEWSKTRSLVACGSSK